MLLFILHVTTFLCKTNNLFFLGGGAARYLIKYKDLCEMIYFRIYEGVLRLNILQSVNS